MTCGCRLPHAETVCSSVPKIIFNNYEFFKNKSYFCFFKTITSWNYLYY